MKIIKCILGIIAFLSFFAFLILSSSIDGVTNWKAWILSEFLSVVFFVGSLKIIDELEWIAHKKRK